MLFGNKQNFEGFWAKYDNYEIFEYNNKFYIKPSKNAEDNVYKNWCIDNCADIWFEEIPYQTPAEYIAKNGENYPEISAWAWALYSFSSEYWIDEVEEFE